MGVNIVKYGNNTLIDLTDTTAEATDVASGKYFYGKDGVKTLGTSSGSWTLLGSTKLTANTTGTSASSLGSITIGSSAYNKSKIIYVRVRDEAGKRAGYFLGSDSFFVNTNNANGSTSTFSTAGRLTHRYSTSSQYGQTASGSTTGYGVYGYSITSAGKVNIYQRYNSTYSLTINGTYKVEVYALSYPDNKSVFDI